MKNKFTIISALFLNQIASFSGYANPTHPAAHPAVASAHPLAPAPIAAPPLLAPPAPLMMPAPQAPAAPLMMPAQAPAAPMMMPMPQATAAPMMMPGAIRPPMPFPTATPSVTEEKKISITLSPDMALEVKTERT